MGEKNYFKADLKEKDIISSIAKKMNVDYKQAKHFLRAFEEVMEQAIIDGKSVRMQSFMSIYINTYKIPNRRNPKSKKYVGEVLKKRVRFKISKRIQDIIDKQAREELNVRV